MIYSAMIPQLANLDNLMLTLITFVGLFSTLFLIRRVSASPLSAPIRWQQLVQKLWLLSILSFVYGFVFVFVYVFVCVFVIVFLLLRVSASPAVSVCPAARRQQLCAKTVRNRKQWKQCHCTRAHIGSPFWLSLSGDQNPKSTQNPLEVRLLHQ